MKTSKEMRLSLILQGSECDKRILKFSQKVTASDFTKIRLWQTDSMNFEARLLWGHKIFQKNRRKSLN